jgi:tetratricopeptide (TPR) repeat protein
MRLNKMHSLISGCLALLLCFVAATAQEAKPAAPADPELERIKELSKQAWQEAEQFNKAGHKDSDPNYPGRKWAATFWQYRQEHPGTTAAARATYEALHFLVHAELFAEFEAKADSLKPDDGAWKELVGTLHEAAERKKDASYFLSKAQWLYQQSPDKEVKVRARFMLAQAHWKRGETEKAKTGFQAVIAEFPGTPQAKRAASNLDEIAYLNLGQAAPLFAYRTTGGAPLALADLKGQVVLLKFWASW